MLKKLAMVFATFMLALVTAACGSNNATDKTSGAQPEAAKQAAPAEITVKHELGETVVKKNPQKVVVFDFGSLDTMDALGVEPVGLPQKSLPSYLDKYKDEKYINVGGLKEPDFEKIHEAKPDLIIIAGRQADKYEEFKKIAPTIYMDVDDKKYMESFTTKVKTLAQIFDKEAKADEMLAKIEKEIKDLNEKTKADEKKALVILANDGKVSAYGSTSRFGIVHDVFGFKQADDKIDSSTHGQSVSFEYILEKNPDYIFVVDRTAAIKKGESSAKQVVENEIVKKTNAVKNNKVIYLDPGYWYLSGGGLESVSEMVKETAAVYK
ncbi:putative ABC transporter solute-binding protein YclQ precursor [Brevibacillus laterosporus]|nr:putative ABC transporter solute-binding protein YclQ precursor [Brevibacillus laterosporus]